MIAADTSPIEGAAIIAIVVNVAALIWGAAKLSSSVEHLEKTVSEIKGIVMGTQELVHNVIGRIWVLEDHAGIPHRRATDRAETKSD